MFEFSRKAPSEVISWQMNVMLWQQCNMLMLVCFPGCRLNCQTLTVAGYVGKSVLLPCSCSELQTKPHTLTWTFLKRSDYKEIFPKHETNLYTEISSIRIILQEISLYSYHMWPAGGWFTTVHYSLSTQMKSFCNKYIKCFCIIKGFHFTAHHILYL